MSDPSTLTEARQAYDERRWADAVTAYESAGPIELSDAERLAWAQLWTFAPAHDCLDAFERLEQAALEAGDREVAARAALEQVRMHAMLDNGVLTGSCYQRASKHAGAGTAVSRMVRFYSALGLLASGDHGAAAAIASELLPQARAAGDVTLEALATWAIGSDTVMNGAVDDGLAQLDEAMTMAITQPVHPLYAAMITCGVVVTCRAIGDWNRAKEWTEAADRYCHREAVCHYPGHCSIFRAETRRLDGEFDAASREASKALELAGDWARAWTGMAHHQQGEAELCRGDLGRAQAAFTRAIEAGHPPQPGLARLHLAAGDPTAALRSISETIDSAGAYTDADRLLTLSAAVSIALAADDRDAATRWSDQLEHGCSRFGTTAWRAATAQAKGELALADLDAASAEQHLRAATTEWSSAGSPIDAARCRRLLASAIERTGRAAEAKVERDVALSTLARLGAEFDLAHEMIRAHSGPDRTRKTLSFTDIVASSELLAAMGDDAWAQVLRAHDRILREALTDFGGSEVKHEGDGLFVAFADESDAVGWAVVVQQRLAEHREHHGFAPQVRIGVHCGDATHYGDDLIGRCVHETARIANAADGGEILVSHVTAEGLDQSFRVRATRALELKGFDEPYEVLDIDWSTSRPA